MTNRVIKLRSLLILWLALIWLWLPGCGSESTSSLPQSQQESNLTAPQDRGRQEVSESLTPTSGPANIIVERNVAGRPQQAVVTEDPEEIVVPPSEAGGRGLTRRERDELIKAQAAKDKDLENEVASITVDPKTGKGLTWKELEEILRQNEKPLDNEVASITIDESGQGMTWKEFEAFLKNQPQFDLDMESGMSDTPDGKPLTYRELERLSDQNSSQTKEVQP